MILFYFWLKSRLKKKKIIQKLGIFGFKWNFRNHKNAILGADFIVEYFPFEHMSKYTTNIFLMKQCWTTKI